MHSCDQTKAQTAARYGAVTAALCEIAHLCSRLAPQAQVVSIELMSAEKPALPAATPRFDTIDTMRGYSILVVVLPHIWLRPYLLDMTSAG